MSALHGPWQLDEQPSPIGPGWVLRSEETASGWLIYNFHLETGTKVPPRPMPTRDPERARAEEIGSWNRLNESHSKQHAEWLRGKPFDRPCPMCGRGGQP